MKGEARKKAFLDERKILRERESKMRQENIKEEDVLVIKTVKKEIIAARRFNKEKTDQINRA